ncbi:aminopeptidase N [Thalassotalea profundi]|uniref:Aminopeptidase N n=1 Tax=Thalassotalea profundi TaxID=2036687 RepID=A0ABQ3IKQ9_9GAMM|nr:aminopeptidase N [Thalassotalea profundi]GHE83770.1 aminopeptidase N [Thalassotalea profundi]
MTEFNARYLKDYLPSDFSINTIDLTFELDDNKTKVTSVMSISKNTSEANKIILNGEQLKLIAVYYNDTALNASEYQVDDDSLSFLIKDNECTVKIVTEIDPENNTSLEGLFKSGGAFCTQCEAEGFRRITYYLDRPDVMAKFTTKVIADKNLYPYLLSNGNKIDSGDLNNNRHFVTWEDPFLKPCYLFALVAGDFDLLQDSYKTTSGRDVRLEIFVDKGNKTKAHHAMASLKHSMRWDEDTFGLEYDLDIYMIVAVDFFNMGAMENKGLNVFNSKFVLADKETATDTDYFNVEAVIAHEYFHNWTGNRVTCRDWFQLSLKEGLTVFRDQQFSADMHSAAVTRIKNVRVMRAQQFSEDAGPMSHPIRPEKVVEMNNFYTLTVYEKGSEVIRMLHTLLGKDKFRQGLDLYFQRFDGQAVTCDDFVTAMADAAKIDLILFKRWYSQSGTPIVKVEESFNTNSGEYQINLSQLTLPTKDQATKYALHIPIAIELINNEGTQSHLLELKSDNQQWRFSGFHEKPTLGFLANFSAPVKVDFEQSNSDLAIIMTSAKDKFLRWDAGQKLFSNTISQIITDTNYQIPAELIDILATQLCDNSDPALIAEQFTLPNFHELVEQFKPINPIKLVDALDKLKLFIAKGLEKQLLSIYQALADKPYLNNAQSIGDRALKNMSLSYLVLLPEHHDLVKRQYLTSDNMTDALAALQSSATQTVESFDAMMASFEQRWENTTLVMDKWFSLQAAYKGSNIFERLKNLTEHSLFSLKNPNRARSLIGAFAQNNSRYFHCETGRGYQFLADQICSLNAINPQVASRLITALIQYQDFDEYRQNLMKSQLERIAILPNLSKDLKEKLDAAL